MAEISRSKVYLNRIVSFVAGGLLVLAVMSLTVVSTEKAKNVELTKALDASLYEAGKLLAAAKSNYTTANYSGAQSELTSLFDKHPGSPEAVEGRMLYEKAVTEQAALDARWAAAMPEIEKTWTRKMAADLREKSDLERAELEKGLSETVSQAWEKAKDQVRMDWEKQL